MGAEGTGPGAMLRGPLPRTMPAMAVKIRFPKLPSLGMLRKPPKSRSSSTQGAERRPPVGKHRAPNQDYAEGSSRGRTRLKYGPEGRQVSTRSQLAARPAPKRPAGYRETAPSDRPEAPVRPYPARQISNLREAPVVRAGTRRQLAERHETLAASRRRGYDPNASGRELRSGARGQLGTRPSRGTQVQTYPEPYERRKATATLPTVGRRSNKEHPARGAVPRPRAPLPGDATPINRMGGAKMRGGNSAADSPHPFFGRPPRKAST